MEIQELDLLWAELAKNVRCAGDQGNGFLQELEKTRVAHSSGTDGGERAAESGNAWSGRDRALEKVT